MTLRSLNTRYAKPIRKMVVMGAGLLLAAVSLLSPLCWGAEISGFTRRPVEAGPRCGDSSVVAPLFVNEQKLIASDGAAGDEFGNSVAFSGSTLVVGAPDTVDGNPDQGSAYVFNRQGAAWVEAQKLTASDGAADNFFGWSVAVSGSTIVVGASHEDIGGNAEQGSAYVFKRQGGRWVEMQKLTASDGAVLTRFGWSVAVSGSTIIVGTLSANIADNFRGAAYVFNLQGGNWVETQKLTASEGSRFDTFGWSVATSGSKVVVGATGDNFQGSAYVFTHRGGSWVVEQKLTASDARLADEFGWSVAVSGSTVVVGALSVNTPELQGSAYVFNLQGGSWVETQKLTASDAAAFDEFGYSVAISGSTIIVGSPGDDAIGGGGNTAQGSAYVFDRQGENWVETQKLTASDGGDVDFFGKSVAVNGSTVVVSAQHDTVGPNFNQGSAYVFNRRGIAGAIASF